MAKTTDTIMTLNNLAACAKRSRPSPYTLYQAGKAPDTKVGCHWRFHKDAIDAQRDERIVDMEKQLKQRRRTRTLFAIRREVK